MTVKEMITVLSELPEEMEVVYGTTIEDALCAEYVDVREKDDFTCIKQVVIIS